jgi:hypothetical protein
VRAVASLPRLAEESAVGEILVSAEDVQRRVCELGEQFSHD